MFKIKLIFGTAGGNTEIVCEKVSRILREVSEVELEVKRAKISTPEDLFGADLLILACPTFRHGLLENFMDRLLNKAKDVDLKGQKCAVIGLGDPLYEQDYLAEAANILKEFVKERGGELVSEPLRVTGSALPYLLEEVPEWTNNLINTLNLK